MRMNAFAKTWPFIRPAAGIWDAAGDDVIAIHGPDGRFLKVSAAAETMFGVSATKLVGMRLMDVFSPDTQASLLAALSRVANTEGVGRARFEGRLRRGDIERAWVEIALVRLSNGRMRSVTRPVEHRRARETAIREESQQALALASRRTDHLTNVSHEIRTPLNAIIGFADALHSERFGAIGSDRYRDYARAIHDSGAHLQTLITDLLDLSKAEADEMIVDLEAVSLAEIVQCCADIMQLQANDANLYLRTVIDPRIGESMLDTKIVRQIILNIVANALKFTKVGGVTINVHRDGAMLTVAVVDTGVGMSPDDLALVGQRFKQARTEGVRGARGTGIGLALSKALARVHGGELSLMSSLGEGTTALLRLPHRSPDTNDVSSFEEPSNVMRLPTKKRA